MHTQQMEEKLWEYIDGLSSEEEKASIQQLLRSDHQWKGKYNELMELNHMLNSTELEQPSMRFAQNIMEEIVKQHIAPATKTYINKRIIYGIGGFLISMLAGLIIYLTVELISQEGSSSSSFARDLGRMSWSEVFNNTYTNIFLFANVVLGLMLFDRYLNLKKDKSKSRNA